MTLERFLDAGGMAVIGVIVGAFLTYLFGSLTRRRQEKRDEKTRWYDARLQAYVELYQAAYDAYFTAYGNRPSTEVSSTLGQRLLTAVGTIHFVGSPEVIESAEKVLDDALEELGSDRDMRGDFLDTLELFQAVARKDLGHPVKSKKKPSRPG
jgi:hypothetical protein